VTHSSSAACFIDRWRAVASKARKPFRDGIRISFTYLFQLEMLVFHPGASTLSIKLQAPDDTNAAKLLRDDLDI
jgi:hypothetical protein